MALNEHYIHETYLVDRTKPTMPELIELGEEISGDLESAEVEEQVETVAVAGSICFVIPGAAAALQPPLQARAEKRKETHGGINRRIEANKLVEPSRIS